jgi:type I restriction enzyme M protein
MRGCPGGDPGYPLVNSPMARTKKAEKTSSTANIGFEAKLWQAANKMRNNMDAGEYKHVVLGLIFLKYISDAFEEQKKKLERDKSADPEDKDEYLADNVFWVPKTARWHHIQSQARQATIGKVIDDAMVEIEKDNNSLKGVLPKDFARPGLNKQRLGELIDLIGTIGLGDEENRSKDVLGRVYEYFIMQFASAEGKKSGQFYTPSSIVRLIVKMLSPYKGRIYDPACGSGGMFVQSEKFVRAHGGKIGDISVYGQESNHTTRRLAQMNLAIRGIEANLGTKHEDTFREDLHKDLKADYILANPPFNDSDWSFRPDDIRWKFGIPPRGNANYGWVQHIIHHLAPKGKAGFVLGNMSLTSETGGEDEMRKKLIQSNLVECIITLPDKLFYSTPIPVGIWILNRDKQSNKGRSRKDILFIDASKLGVDTSRTHRELSDSDISKLTDVYLKWQKDEGYTDEAGFSKSATPDEVLLNKFKLLPATYVNEGRSETQTCIRISEWLNPENEIAIRTTISNTESNDHDYLAAFKSIISEIKEAEKRVKIKTFKLSDVLERTNERLGDREEPEILTCTESGGLILQRERFAKRVATNDASDYKYVRKGDIVYNPYLLWKGSIDQCWIVENGITSPAYEVFKIKPGFNQTIVGQLLTSPEMIKRYDGISFGTVQRRRRAAPENFLKIEVNMPCSEHLNEISDLINKAQTCQISHRNAERQLREFIKATCGKLRQDK